ncbi:hypothetical protein [Lentzea flava]|uniref:Uncharacterized protein n=1 Tax=Lentzea flava TaxID=103732 RepID=A0ABQ2UGX1_9PSEU|nr:hypothetical protein [Lentzea flava]MCP2198656.1 hypothetical protein [Lentzea flava]GGU29160.1 hypothetical protein GCM10010178_21660 [Lentzea flava]
MARPSREAVARWNTAYAEQTAALFEASSTGEKNALIRLALGYSAVAQAWRILAADLAVPLWVRHACSIAAEEFERRARLEQSRFGEES